MIAKRVDAIHESYKTFRYNDPKGRQYLTPRQYKTFISAFLDELGYLLITTGQRITLPSCLGSLQAVRYKYKRKLVDFNKTSNKKAAEGEDAPSMFFSNMATNGYWVYVHWSKRESPYAVHAGRFRHSRSYAFRLQRSLKRRRKDIPDHKQPRVTLVEFFREKGHYMYSEPR